MGFMSELKRLARPYEDEDDFDEFESIPTSSRSDRRENTASIDLGETPRRNSGNKVVNLHTTTQLQVVLVKTDKYESAADIADHLREKRTVVLNLESASKDVSRRLLDFLAGVTYANGGKIKRIASGTFIITPFNVDILGDLLDELENNGLYF